jgi:hypothetical protein
VYAAGQGLNLFFLSVHGQVGIKYVPVFFSQTYYYSTVGTLCRSHCSK